MDCK